MQKNRESVRETARKRLTPFRHYVVSLVPTGSENAIHAYTLAKIAGTNGRTVRRAVSDARNLGEVILSNDSGYFRPSIPKDAELVRKYIAAQSKRARSSFRSVKSAKRLLGEIETDNAVENMQKVLEGLNHVEI